MRGLAIWVVAACAVAACEAHEPVGSVKTDGDETWFVSGGTFYKQLNLKHTFEAGTANGAESTSYSLKYSLVEDTYAVKSEDGVDLITLNDCDISLDYATDFTKFLDFTNSLTQLKETTEVTDSYKMVQISGNVLAQPLTCNYVHTFWYHPLTPQATRKLEQLSGLSATDNTPPSFKKPEAWGYVVLIHLVTTAVLVTIVVGGLKATKYRPSFSGKTGIKFQHIDAGLL